MKFKIKRHKCNSRFIIKYKWGIIWLSERYGYDAFIQEFDTVKQAKKYLKKHYKKSSINIVEIIK